MVLMFCALLSAAQQKKHNPADLIKSMNWDIIGSVNFKLNTDNKILPVYGELIKRFENQDFSLKGYIIPIKTGMKQKQFLLSSLPINQCFFCGQNGVPAMILVNMETPIAYVTAPVLIQGTLKLENVDAATAAPITLNQSRLLSQVKSGK